MVRLVDYEDDDDDDDLPDMYSSGLSSFSYEGNSSRNPISFQSSSSSSSSSSEDEDLNKAVKASLESYSKEDDISQDIKVSLETAKNKRAFDFFQNYDDFQVKKYSPYYAPRKLYKGESSNSKAETVYIDTDDRQSWEKINNVGKVTFLCCVCVDEKPKTELFQLKGCPHSYCFECIAKYLATTLKAKITNIKCPVLGCEVRLEPEHCRSFLPSQVIDRWGDALCEALILGSEKYYCPFEDCSALFINDGAMGDDDHHERITIAKCPYCRRRFCAQCRVPWHFKMSCFQFQTRNKDQRQKKHIKTKRLKTYNPDRQAPCALTRSREDINGGI